MHAVADCFEDAVDAIQELAEMCAPEDAVEWQRDARSLWADGLAVRVKAEEWAA